MTNKTTIELTRVYDAPVSVLFDAIKQGQLLVATQIKSDSFKHDFRVGGEYFMEWTCIKGSSCFGKYLAIVPDKQVKFTWKSAGCKSACSDETIVTVTLEAVGNKTEMKLVHENLDSGFCAEDHLAGWTSCLEEFQPSAAAVS